MTRLRDERDNFKAQVAYLKVQLGARITREQAQVEFDVVAIGLFYTNWLAHNSYDYSIWNQHVDLAHKWDNDPTYLVNRRRWRHERAKALVVAVAAHPLPNVVAVDPHDHDKPQA